MERSIEQKIASIFHLHVFEATTHPPKKEDGQPQYVKLIWAAKLHYYDSPLVVSVMHTATGIEGLLFALPETGKNYTAELPDWVDPVEQALHSVDLAAGASVSYGGYSCSYDLRIEARFLSSQISGVMDPGNNTSLVNIGEGIFTAIDEIAKHCNQRGVKRLFKFTQDPNAE